MKGFYNNSEEYYAQVVAKMKSRHMKGTFTKKKKCKPKSDHADGTYFYLSKLILATICLQASSFESIMTFQHGPEGRRTRAVSRRLILG